MLYKCAKGINGERECQVDKKDELYFWFFLQISLSFWVSTHFNAFLIHIKSYG